MQCGKEVRGVHARDVKNLFTHVLNEYPLAAILSKFIYLVQTKNETDFFKIIITELFSVFQFSTTSKVNGAYLQESGNSEKCNIDSKRKPSRQEETSV